MARDALNDLAALVAVADARSFTRAAEQLGCHPPRSATRCVDWRSGSASAC